MSFVFHPEAEAEFEAAVAWYEEHEAGLGLDFASEVDATIRQALVMPLAWPALDEGIRRVLVNRFPYGIIYAPSDDGIFIVGVMHLRREPDYWRKRLA